MKSSCLADDEVFMSVAAISLILPFMLLQHINTKVKKNNYNLRSISPEEAGSHDVLAAQPYYDTGLLLSFHHT